MSEMPTVAEVREAEIEFLLDMRDAVCRELRAIERRLERLGHPVRDPKVKPPLPMAIGAQSEK
jgi:hypothetical protein